MPAAFRYEKATRPTSGAQSGTMNLYRHLLNSPIWSKMFGLGVYNNRNARDQDWLSIHAEGRALDAGYEIADEAEGWRLFELLIAKHVELGIQQVLYRGKGWRVGKGRFNLSARSRALHERHLHVEMIRSKAASLTEADVARIMGEPIPEPVLLLRQGDSSPCVVGLQLWLKALRFSVGTTGVFDVATYDAVSALQTMARASDPDMKIDGIFGPQTLAAMIDRQSPADFLQSIYLAQLGRLPDAEGLAYWLDRVADVGRLDAAAEFFSASQAEASAPPVVVPPALPPVVVSPAIPPMPAPPKPEDLAPPLQFEPLSDTEICDAVADVIERREA